MSTDKGKKWEEHVVASWMTSFPNSFCLRLPDQQSHYNGSKNPSDFIGFIDGKLYLIECKSIKGNTLPLKNLTQYESLLTYKGSKGIYTGFLIWWWEKDKVAWIPVDTITQLKKEGKKSVHLNILEDENYVTYSLPIIKKRVYVDCDFSILKELDYENRRQN